MVRKKEESPARKHDLDNRLRTKDFTDRLDGLAYRYDYTYALVKYLKKHSAIDPDVLRRITECYNYAVGGLFRDPKIGIRIFKSNSCKQHRLCANCAHIRAKRNAMILAEIVYCLMQMHPDHKPIFTTITVKNGPNIGERFKHLMNGFKRLQKLRKNAIEGQRPSMRSRVLGGLFSCEIKHTNKRLWHPHLHGLEFVPSDFDVKAYDTELEQHWFDITGDSMITRVKDIKMDSPESLIKSCMEICKYSMKQASMTPAQQYEAYKATSRKQLVRRFGVFRGFTFDESYDVAKFHQDLSQSPYREFLLKRRSDKGGTTFKSYWGKEYSGYRSELYHFFELDDYPATKTVTTTAGYSLDDLKSIDWSEL